MQQQMTKIAIPDDVDFADLRLARDADGDVSFDWAVIARICEASGIDPALFRDGPEDNVAGLINHWYLAHLQKGGERDAVADDIISETIAEELAGQIFSLPPGRS